MAMVIRRWTLPMFVITPMAVVTSLMVIVSTLMAIITALMAIIVAVLMAGRFIKLNRTPFLVFMCLRRFFMAPFMSIRSLILARFRFRADMLDHAGIVAPGIDAGDTE
jgi:hypothetical protein